MTPEAFAARWAATLGPRWRTNVPLAPFTTFRVGGPADYLAEVVSEAELVALAQEAEAAGLPISVLGGGSNVLVADAGVRGVVLRLRLNAIEQRNPSSVRAEGGVTINGLVRWLIGRGLAGLEAWAGTPGTVGGAIYGNAHWGGQDIGSLVTAVRLVDRTGRIVEVPNAAMGFAYDTSRLKQTREIVVSADFRVETGAPADLRQTARRSLHYRKTTQPLAMPSAGCVFQNPPATVPLPDSVPRSAGALVDRAGLKGYRVGGARISEHHANFIVNDGNATAADIRALVETAREAVRATFGAVLLDEIVYLGNFEHG